MHCSDFRSESGQHLTPTEILPTGEAAQRQSRCRKLLAERLPQAGGLLIAGRVNIYYLTGTLASGLLWLPLTGEPLLMVRKGDCRARLETSSVTVARFTSFREVPRLAEAAGSPLSACIAIDKDSFSWSMAELLSSRLKGITFTAADNLLMTLRSVKSEFEKKKLRTAGLIHAKILDNILPEAIRPGMSEREIAVCYATESMLNGSSGLSRCNATGEEMHFGYVSVGVNGMYPTYFNGPLGCRGEHAAVPFLGSRDVIWEENMLLTCDMTCDFEGYNTDRTQVYWSGSTQSIPKEACKAQEACKIILEEALAALRPGNTPAQLWQTAADSARRLGYGDQFMGSGSDKVPFLGHGIGLNVDERPAIARSFSEPFVKDMAMALEPKICVPSIGMVGIEHTYLVTEDTPEPLTGTCRDIRLVT